MKTFDEYRGIGYERASREAMRLIREAARSQIWADLLPERLIQLRSILLREGDWNQPKKPIDGTGWAEAAFEPMTNQELFRWAREEGGPIVDCQY